MLWRNDNAIVVGRNQNTFEEVNIRFAQKQNIHVVRRMSGGGAVYHDLNNVNFSFMTALGNPSEITMDRFTRPVVEALISMGIPAESSGRNDILVEGRKVSGNAQAIIRDRILHHGTLLFDVNGSLLGRALNVDPEKYRSKGARSVRSHVAGLKNFLPKGTSVTSFMDMLMRRLAPDRSPAPVNLSSDEKEQILALRDRKYASLDWIYGENPAFVFGNRRKFPGGILDVRFNVRGGRIEDCAIYGDFMAVREISPIIAALRGAPYSPRIIGDILKRFPIEHYFGAISRKEIIQCMFFN